MASKHSFWNPLQPPHNKYGEYRIEDVHSPRFLEGPHGTFLEGSADMSQSSVNPDLAEAPFRMKVDCKSNGFAVNYKDKCIARVYEKPFWETGKIWYEHGYPDGDKTRFKKFCKECGLSKSQNNE